MEPRWVTRRRRARRARDRARHAREAQQGASGPPRSPAAALGTAPKQGGDDERRGQPAPPEGARRIA
eukprot:6061571-Lingulodinium_polyedra.AAC.1